MLKYSYIYIKMGHFYYCSHKNVNSVTINLSWWKTL